MKRAHFAAGLLLLLIVSACSLQPERPFTRQDLFRTNIFNYFKINESPDSILAIINSEGEVVIIGELKGKEKTEYFVKVTAKENKLKTTFWVK